MTVRPAAAADGAECGRILYAAFAAIAAEHNFPPDFPSIAAATETAARLIAHPGFYGVVAEEDGRILGSNFIDERSPVAGIGPITVDPAAQNHGVGQRPMRVVMDHATARHHAGIRLVQTAYHNRSIALYTRLGFATREPLSVVQGPAIGRTFAGYAVRPAAEADLVACNEICRQVHGFDRGAELFDAIREGSATVVEHLGHIAGFTTGIAFFGYAVADSNQALQALIAAAPAFGGPGFLVPTRNHGLFRWCLDSGLRLVMQMHLMTTGLYQEPCGAYLPSILY